MENQMLPSEEVVFLLKRLDELFAQMIVENDEQKAEIERLTKTLEVADKAFEKQAEEIKTLKLACVDKIQRNEELQKQVDRLKVYIDFKTANIMCDKCNEKAVKDTAKEIYSLMIGEYECYIPTDIAEEIAKRYGVEVE